jgi:N utilization substance protein A
MSNGDVSAYVSKTVVDTVEDQMQQISLEEAKKLQKKAKIDDVIELFVPVEKFGRVAAQTAKQVVLQKLREAEREIIMAEYEDKIGTVINGIVSRVEPRLVRIDLGKAQAIMPGSEQISTERYYPGQRIKVYLKDIEKGFKGPQIIVSRGNREFIEWLFRAEVPEMESGAVEIKEVAREAGVRSKIAVNSLVQGVDPVGTFVGGHGTRVNAVVGEIGEQEKIDIVIWDENPQVFIANALSPTKVNKVSIDASSKRAKVSVPEDQLSIAIGKGGQNVRLASKLTGYEIDIEADKSSTEVATTVDMVQKPKLKKKSELENNLLEAIEEHGE